MSKPDEDPAKLPHWMECWDGLHHAFRDHNKPDADEFTSYCGAQIIDTIMLKYTPFVVMAADEMPTNTCSTCVDRLPEYET